MRVFATLGPAIRFFVIADYIPHVLQQTAGQESAWRQAIQDRKKLKNAENNRDSRMTRIQLGSVRLHRGG